MNPKKNLQNKKNLKHLTKHLIKQNILHNDYKDGGSKSVNIDHKIASLKCSWVKRLYTENFHKWKIIPLQYKNKRFGKTFKFRSNNITSKDTLTYFASFCKDILKLWSKYYPNLPSLPSSIISQPISVV